MSECHKTGLQYIIDHQSEILASILSELIKHYPDLQEQYDYDDEEKSYICQMLERKRIFQSCYHH